MWNPDDPARIALPGGFASGGNYVLVSLPGHLTALGATVIVLAVVRRYRPDPEAPPRTRAAGEGGDDAPQLCRSWRPTLVASACGILLVVCGVLLYQTFVDHADRRIAHGTVWTGRVVTVADTAGADEVTVTYVYEGSEYRTTARGAFGNVDYYRDLDEVELYVDPDDPASIALPGGFVNGRNWVFASLPVTLVALGIVAFIAAVALRFWPVSRPEPGARLAEE